MDHQWVHSSPYQPVPPFAVVGGHDSDGAPMFVGRSHHEGDMLPAKVVPNKGNAYVCWGGQEITKAHYEVLVGQGYGWVPSGGGAVPPNAVLSGRTRNGEPLYIGRGHHANSLTVGKIHPSHGCLYIPFGGHEVRVGTYEVLVKQSTDQWVPAQPHYAPPNAVVAGYDTDRAPIYVARAMHEGEMMPAKFVPNKGSAYVCCGGYEINKISFEVLCGYGYSWVHVYNHAIPPNAVSSGVGRTGQRLFVGRGHHHGSLTPDHKWVHSSAYASMPTNAVIGGNDFDGDPIYVGRTVHNGDTLVAKIVPNKRIAFVSWRGEAIPKDNFEVLCGINLVWLQCYDHRIPENAVLCGKSALGQPVYIGRGHYEGSLSIGKVSSVHRALFIPFKNAERRLESYEILVEQRERKEGWAIDEKPAFPPTFEDVKPPMMPMPPTFAPTPSTDPYGANAPPPSTPTPPPIEPPPPYHPTHVPPTYQSLGVSVYPTLPATPSYKPATAYPQQADTWVVSNANYTPPNAVHAGHDTDLSPIFVCRCFHNGDLLPGKVIPSRACAYVSYAGQELQKSDFEILIGDGYEWVSTADGAVPAGAIEAGRTSDGETLYVGRAHYCGSLTPGKIQPSHRALYIAFGGHERRIPVYEVLVRRSNFYRDESVKICY